MADRQLFAKIHANTGVHSVDSGSITVAAGDYIVLFIVGEFSNTDYVDPTFGGSLGLSFTLVQAPELMWNSNFRHLWVYVARAASGATGNVTVTFAASTTYWIASAIAIETVSTAGTPVDAIVQHKRGSQSLSGAHTYTLSFNSVPVVGNVLVLVSGSNVNPTSLTPEAGWTALVSTSTSGKTWAYAQITRNGDQSASYSNGGSAFHGAHILELLAGGAPPASTVAVLRRRRRRNHA